MDQTSSRRRVTAPYESAYPEPIQVSLGEELTIEHRDTEWDGWVWATNKHGEAGWIPESYVEKRHSGWISLKDYIARELTVENGDVLTSHRAVAGWEWCEKPTGETGWVPTENLQSLPGETT